MADFERQGFRVSECKKISVSEVLDKDNGTLNHVHATLHHWNKYHNPTAEGFMGGEFYLGEECVNCPFSDAQVAIRKLEAEKAVSAFCADKMNEAIKELNERLKWHARMTGHGFVVDAITDAELNGDPNDTSIVDAIPNPSLLQREHAANEDRSIRFKPGRGAGTDAVTTFSKNDGERIEIWHNKPLLNTLGASLLSAIRWWHNGSVRHGSGE